jgi:hypothetical protein
MLQEVGGGMHCFVSFVSIMLPPDHVAAPK